MHADLNRASEVANFFLRALDDRFLGAEADDNLRASVSASRPTIRKISLAFRFSAGNLCAIGSARSGSNLNGISALCKEPSIACDGGLRFCLRYLKGVSRHPGQVDHAAQCDHDPEHFLEADYVVDHFFDLLAEDVSERDDDRHRNRRAREVVKEKNRLGGTPSDPAER